MGVIVTTDTTDIPITMAGSYAAQCWGADTRDPAKNYKRGLECIKNNHGRVLEFPQVYVKVTGYSARVVREFYTHVAGGITRLQASTRYIDYNNFDYIVPLNMSDEAKELYCSTMSTISAAATKLEKELGVAREDAAMLLPLGMTSTMVFRTNLRHIIEISHQRLCTRANWEFRKLMRELIDALAFYSDEWKTLVEELKLFVPKCEVLGYCPETHSCGRTTLTKEERDEILREEELPCP